MPEAPNPVPQIRVPPPPARAAFPAQRPAQAGRPIGPPPAARPPAPAPAGPARPPRAATPYLTFPRLTLAVACLLSVLSPAPIGIGGYSFIGLFLVPTLLALALILVVARAWTYLTAMGLSLLFPLLFLFMFAPHEGGFDPLNREVFWATVLNFGAIALAVAGGVQGFRRTRMGSVPRIRPGIRTTSGVFAVVCLALIVGAMATSYAAKERTLAGTDAGFDFQPQAQRSVVAEGFQFAPRELNVSSNTFTQISVQNTDPVRHTFTYKNAGTEYSHEILAGQTVKFVVFFSQAGAVNFWCIPHSGGESDQDEDSMVGRIIVA